MKKNLCKGSTVSERFAFRFLMFRVTLSEPCVKGINFSFREGQILPYHQYGKIKLDDSN
jgi:hypothetical protein